MGERYRVTVTYHIICNQVVGFVEMLGKKAR